MSAFGFGLCPGPLSIRQPNTTNLINPTQTAYHQRTQWMRPSSRRSRCVWKMTSNDGNDTGKPVKELLSSEDFLERIRGINRVDELSSSSERVSLLIPIATEDSNQQVRYAAISRISNFDPTSLSEADSEKVLTAARYVLVNDRESSCQSGAADLIAGLKLSDGFDDLVDAYNNTSDWMLKFSIAAGLGEMGDPKAFDFLTSILDNHNSSEFLLTAAAIGALGELGDERAIPVIERYLNSDDSSVRERAVIAHDILVSKEG